jgi:hypothetical protein
MFATSRCVGLGLLLVALSGLPQASAQAPKPTKWQFATLTFEESASRDYGSTARWEAGSKLIVVVWDRDRPHPFISLNKQLGGPEPNARIGTLLDRIGQDGWELVSHTSTPNSAQSPAATTQTWSFKRPAP